MKTIIISLGGSLIVPDKIDIKFLKSFKGLILKETKRRKRFIIVSGGGRTCRIYQKAASKISKPSQDMLDWIGIDSTKLNMRLIESIFENQSQITQNPTKHN